MRNFWILLFLFLSLVTEASVSKWDDLSPIPLNQNESGGKYVRTFQSGKLYSKDSIITLAQEGAFQSHSISTLNFITQPDIPFWMYLKTPDVDSSQSIYFIIANCHFNRIRCYKYTNNTLQLQSEKGLQIPYSAEAISPEQIDFKVEPNSIYFFESYSEYNVLLPVYIKDSYSSARSAIDRNLLNAFYWGVLGIISLMALLFFFRSREYLYLFYALFLHGLIFLNLTLEGYFFAYLWPDHPEWNNYQYAFFAFSTFASPFFVYFFLDIRNYIPKFNIVFIFIVIVYIATVSVGALGYFSASLAMLQSIGLFQSIFFLYCGVYVYKKGYKNAIYFIVAWGVYLGSITLTILSATNVIENTPYTNNYMQFGSLFEILVFSLSIAERYQQYKLKDRQSQIALIEILQERESILKNQNVLLESIVDERTKKLNQTNVELNQLNLQLNDIVEKKTWQLQKSLEEIHAYNQQLQQFNYITSHNLRGPLSSLKGLYNLYSTEESTSEKHLYIEKSKDVLNRMDVILTDLNIILSQRSNISSLKESIDFEGIIENNLALLRMRESGAHIITEIADDCKLTGIKAFYESIFYNIISNAMKYKKSSEALTLLIQIKKSSNGICTILIEDNGIGMDMSKVGDKLFGFYKRFHTHVDGKGLGLFITRTQVSLIGGTIRVESFLHKGTTYIIDIPTDDIA